MRLTRRYRFAASHRLHAPTLAEEDNQRLYGKCNNPFGHGHDYEVDVTVRGPVEARSAHVVDAARLDELVRRVVLEPFDHRNLNLEIEAFESVVPTSENLGREICRRLKRNWKQVFPGEYPRLEKVRIAETPRNIFEVSEHEID